MSIPLTSSPASVGFVATVATDSGAVLNGGFETGDFSSWHTGAPAGGSQPGWPPSISSVRSHSGTYSAILGASISGGPEQSGECFMYQDVTVPAGNPALSFWYWPYSEDPFGGDWQECQIQDLNGHFLAQAFLAVPANDQTWRNVTFDLTPYAGQKIRLYFGAFGDGYGDVTYWYVDDVKILQWTRPPSTKIQINSSVPVSYNVAVDQSWLDVTPSGTQSNGVATTPNQLTVDANGAISLGVGTYTAHITLTPALGFLPTVPTLAYVVSASGKFPLPFQKMLSDNAMSTYAFSPVDSSAYWAFYSDIAGTQTAETYLVKIDRQANAVVWAIAIHNQVAYQPAILEVTGDGSAVIIVYTSGTFASGKVEKYRTSDGAVLASQDLHIQFTDTDLNYNWDIATINGVEYLAVAGLDHASYPSDLPRHLFVLRTSDLAIVVHRTTDPGSGATMTTPVAFDGSGNVWWFADNNTSRTLEKVSLPGGVPTDYTLSSSQLSGYSPSNIEGMTYDPSDGTLILISSPRAGPTFKLSITGVPTVTTSNPQYQSSAGQLGSSGMTSSKLKGGAAYFGAPNFLLVAHDLSIAATYITPLTNADPHISSPWNLDAGGNNPHKSGTVDMTLWAFTPQAFDHFEWMDLALVLPLTITVTLTLSTNGTVVITKQVTAPSGDPQKFTINPSWKAAIQLADGQSDSTSLAPGVYSVSEVLPFGWDQVDTVVSSGDLPSAINLAVGQTVTVTFKNRRPPGPVDFARGIGPVENELLAVKVDNGKQAGNWFELHAFSLYGKVAQPGRRG